MRRARVGQRIADRCGEQGTIKNIKGHVATVEWADGSWTKVPIDSLHRPVNVHRTRTVTLILTVAAVMALIVAVSGLYPD